MNRVEKSASLQDNRLCNDDPLEKMPFLEGTECIIEKSE